MGKTTITRMDDTAEGRAVQTSKTYWVVNELEIGTLREPKTGGGGWPEKWVFRQLCFARKKRSE